MCRKYRTDLNPPQNLESNTDHNKDDPAKDQKCDYEFDECILVLGADWAWRAQYNFSYTGVKGVHYCKDCLCKLSDLKKGATQTPHPLATYEELSSDKIKFETRTFKQLQVDFKKYKESGDPRFTTVNLANCLEALAQ